MPIGTQSRLGPYEIISLLGAGAMGEVYRARDTRLGREVALKIVDASVGGDEERSRRFEQEARAASALNHPNIVTIHDTGHEGQLLYIVTELVEGESLRRVIQANAPLPMKQVLDIGIQIADGLAAAHDNGIVHRDLKPENIMITREGRVKILDFGLAKPFEDGALSESGRTLSVNDTAPGLLLGTAAYMSPEQAKGSRVSGYADQFALGLVLYEMASGVQAFRRDNPLVTLSAILTEDAPELKQGSAPFQWLVKRCMHKDPDHRYRSTHDLIRELRNIRDHLTGTVEVGDPPPEEPTQSVERKWIRPALWMAAVVLSGLVGFLLSISFKTRSSVRWPELRLLSHSMPAAHEVFPAWAPDGRTLAYSADVEGIFQIVVRRTGVATPIQLTESAKHCFFPFWSPDGTRLYYISEEALWSVNPSGGPSEKVLDNVAQAAIAPDGRTFAALRREGNRYAIWTGSFPTRKETQHDLQ